MAKYFHKKKRITIKLQQKKMCNKTKYSKNIMALNNSRKLQ